MLWLGVSSILYGRSRAYLYLSSDYMTTRNGVYETATSKFRDVDTTNLKVLTPRQSKLAVKAYLTHRDAVSVDMVYSAKSSES